MKAIILTIFSLNLLVSSVFLMASNSNYTEGPPKEKLITDTIIYDVRIENMKQFNRTSNDYYGHINIEEREAFFSALFTSVMKGQIKVYNDNLNLFSKTEATERVDAYLGYKAVQEDYEDDGVTDVVNIENIHYVRFVEQWVFLGNNKFNKKLLAYAPVVADYEDNLTITSYKTLFWIKGDRSLGKKKVFCSKIAYVLDEENKDTTSSAIGRSVNLSKCSKQILRDFNDKKLTAYFSADLMREINPAAFFKEETKIIKKKGDKSNPEIAALLRDTLYVKAKASNLEEDIKQYIFIEFWLYDVVNFAISKEVISYCPLIPLIGQNNKGQHYKELWIRNKTN